MTLALRTLKVNRLVGFYELNFRSNPEVLGGPGGGPKK